MQLFDVASWTHPAPGLSGRTMARPLQSQTPPSRQHGASGTSSTQETAFSSVFWWSWRIVTFSNEKIEIEKNICKSIHATRTILKLGHCAKRCCWQWWHNGMKGSDQLCLCPSVRERGMTKAGGLSSVDRQLAHWHHWYVHTAGCTLIYSKNNNKNNHHAAVSSAASH